jgi:DNA invertase Pin-like site-specific DNA recombinase
MIGRQLRCVIWCAVSSRAQNEPEKISLPQQERDSRAVALQFDWAIKEVLRVTGHSRRYIDFHELAADAAQEGIDAFHRLLHHWEARDFDVLVVRDAERFARTQALHAYITERTINIGARIYSLQDGWVDEQNYRMWIAMAGYKAAGDIDRLVKVRDEAMSARAKRGLPISSRVPISHKVLRDPQSGKALRLEVDENKRRLWDDLALVILEGVGWDSIELALYNRYGHVNAKGDPYYPNYMYRLIMKPLFWGHIARYHNSAESKNGFRYGQWIYDETAPLPEGVVIFRNTHPAVWTGDVADKLRQEINRRSEHMRGKASSSYTHRLSGLAVCGECGHFMSTYVDDGYRAIYCPAAKGRNLLPKCGNKGVTSERRIASRFNNFLAQMLGESTTDIFSERLPPSVNSHERLETLGAEIVQLEDQARILIRKQITAGEDLQRVYDEEISKVGEQLRIVKDARLRLQGEALAAQPQSAVRRAMLEE